MQKFNIGDIVVSTAGRDIGNFYVVSEVVDENYVLVVDGKTKPIEKPKKKKNKHLLFLGQNETDFEQKLLTKDIDNNSYIKKIIKNFEKC